MLRSRLPPAVLHGDVVALFVIFALTVVASWDSLRGSETVVGMDAATQFYPWYSFLGESLWSGEIPAWNPHLYSGTPFLADPLSGWTYLPAMLLFTLLPLTTAAKGYLFFHLLLAGLSVYALARALGMGAPGALLAAVAYQYGGFLYLQNPCCFAYVAVMAWLPLALVGAEMAVRSPLRLPRALWWGVSGLALSQILAAWLGQGSYYALLTLGGYVAYRTLLFTPGGIVGAKTRLLRAVMHGGAVLAFGFGLAAAGILPRLEFNALSNLAGGYPEVGDQAESVGGWSARDWTWLLEPGYWYAGLTVLALALLAPLVARVRFAVPYSATLVLCALVLSGQGPTPLHSALYLLLPRFDQLHPHSPERVVMVLYLGVALLAGATLTALLERRAVEGSYRPVSLFVLAGLSLVATSTLFSPVEEPEDAAEGPSSLQLLVDSGVTIPPVALLALVLAVALVAVCVRYAAWRGLLAAGLLVLVVFADLFAVGRAETFRHDGIAEGGVSLDLAEYYGPSGAARFLRSADAEAPSRYVGYGPQYGYWSTVSSPTRFAQDQAWRALEAGNRAMSHGLHNVQGYNAVRLARYDEYVRALNGREQSRHHADVFEGGLDSPLLDLLGVRHVVVPAGIPSDNRPGLDTAPVHREDLRRLEGEFPVVYEDEASKVLENPEAMPRAWIVHSARQVGSRQEALDLLSAGQVDPEKTALLEEPPPRDLSEPDDASADRASITQYGADRISLETATGAPGLLVLGEVYYPAWRAYVDGSPVPIHVADHLLRSVPVPAGEHTVELRYESWTLRVGMAISLFTLAALISLSIAAGLLRYRRTGEGPSAGGSW